MDQEQWRQRVLDGMTGECWIPEHTALPPVPGVTRPNVHGGLTVAREHLGRYAVAIRDWMKPGTRVLDIGCGVGILSRAAFVWTGVPVVALDTPDTLELGALLYPCPGVLRFPCDLRDLFPLPLPVQQLGPYDVAVLIEVYEHLSEQHGKMLLREIADVLVDDGVLLLHTPVDAHDEGVTFHLRHFSTREEVVDEVQPLLRPGQTVAWIDADA